MANIEEILASTLGGYLGAQESPDYNATSVSQKALQTMVKYISAVETAAPQVIDMCKDNLQVMLQESLKAHGEAKNTTIYIRFFELAVEIALVSGRLCQQISKPVIAHVFSDFFGCFKEDILTQVTIMDFVVKLSESPHGVKVMNESAFIENLFSTFAGNDSFGFISSNMLLVGAKLYSEGSTTETSELLFNPFENKNYMQMLRAYLCEDLGKPHLKDIGLSCLYHLFIRKDHCLVKYFVEREENHALINAFLRVAKTTNEEQRKCFLVAMRQLLKVHHKKDVDPSLVKPGEVLSDRESEIVQMIFSNVTSPERFPSGFGKIDDSVALIAKIADTPYENEGLFCLRLIKQLVKHTWGCKAWFRNANAIKYTLERKGGLQAKGAEKAIIEKKFSLVNQLVKESEFILQDGFIDSVIATQL